jgi:hypothetical protein
MVERSQISILTSPFKQTAVGVIPEESSTARWRISQAPTQRVKELMPQR